uniref:TLR adaptor interacting with endolysosomal SLC15A4 n=1 Tax=Leptobrachium leishanense TaxID=445787 RepID=A0A8C5LXH2_9ANUR
MGALLPDSQCAAGGVRDGDTLRFPFQSVARRPRPHGEVGGSRAGSRKLASLPGCDRHDMLSEGYLYRIQSWYEDDILYHERRKSESTNELSSICSLNHSSVQNARSRKFLHKFSSRGKSALGVQSVETTQKKVLRNLINQETENVPSERETSQSSDIAGAMPSSKETYLVPSSCKNICRDYNDLHIAGDYVMAMNSVLSDTCNSSFEFCEGPFLESSQIPPTMESMSVVSENVSKKPDKAEAPCWKAGSIRDKSIIHHEHPLSNSVLNEYLERKVIELYKQYFMDCSSSANDIIASEPVMNNVEQISMHLSREQNMETNKVKDMVMNFLQRLASEKHSLVISTPDLQISTD